MVWQLALAGFLVLLPFALLFDLHPHRERLDASGLPLGREWRGDWTAPIDRDATPPDPEVRA
jgi:hypothetical protein